MLFGTYTDCYPARGITVRMPHDDSRPVELFVGGWRTGFYKTERGLRAAIERHREHGATLPERRVMRPKHTAVRPNMVCPPGCPACAAAR